MNEGQQVLTAVCGQKCGTVEVPMADTKDCPQCGHPLTESPKPAEKPALPSGADLDAAAAEESAKRATAAVWPTGGKVADGTPIGNLQTAPGTAADILSDIKASLLETALLPEDGKLTVLRGTLAGILIALGYDSPKAIELTDNAIANVGK